MDLYFILFATLIPMLITFLRYKYQYWELNGVPQLKMNFLFGNFFRLRTIHQSELIHEVYQQFRNKVKLAGTYVFTRPILIALDLDLIKSILIKDFNIFADRSEYIGDTKNTLSDSLFVLSREQWRPLRNKLSPTFTSAKMKFMFPTVAAVAGQLGEVFASELAQTSSVVMDIHDMMSRFTTDVIGQCVFGIECNSLRNPDVEFRRIGHAVFYPKLASIRLRLFMLNYPVIFKILKFFKINRLSNDIEVFIMRMVRDNVRMREEQNIQRSDFLNLLIEMKNSKDDKGMPLLTIEEMAAQSLLFFAAGFETSSSNMAFGLYELAKNQHVQDKLRAEVKSVLEKHNGQMTYEAIMETFYMDQVIKESLRKYPPLAALTRVSLEDYKVPHTDITLDKGTRVFIPLKDIHYDPDIYDNPHEFRPERFDPEEALKRHPQTFLGFGDGPRNCIGLRFGRMQVRAGLIVLLKSYRFSLCEQTPSDIQISENSNVLVPKNKIWLKVEKL